MQKILQTLMAGHVAFLNHFANRKSIYVLMYHRVQDSLPPSDLIISRELFREQMAYLKKYCHVMGVEELEDVITGRCMGRHRKPQVVITIDDGYRDAFLNAYPILKEFNLPAVVFLTTSYIGTKNAMRRYEGMPVPDMLSWEDVETMRKNNIIFGAHTVSHPHLPALNYAQQKAEIEQSIKTVYGRTRAQISRDIFCYPYGEYNEDTLKILKELGVKIAFSVHSGINNINTKPLELKRTGLDGRYGIAHFIANFYPPIISGLKWRLN